VLQRLGGGGMACDAGRKLSAGGSAGDRRSIHGAMDAGCCGGRKAWQRWGGAAIHHNE
jgi:hypothetical protein